MYYIIGDSPDTVFGFSVENRNRSKFISYNNVISVSSKISIGLIKRDDGSFQLGARFTDDYGIASYFTATNDKSYNANDLNLSDISIVSTGFNSVSCTAVISGKTGIILLCH